MQLCRVLFRICSVFFPPLFPNLPHLDLIHPPPAFISESPHTFASELPAEFLMLNSQTSDFADHLSPELIKVIRIFFFLGWDLQNHILQGNHRLLLRACTHTYAFGGSALWKKIRFGSVYGYFCKLPRCRSASKFRKLISVSVPIWSLKVAVILQSRSHQQGLCSWEKCLSENRMADGFSAGGVYDVIM